MNLPVSGTVIIMVIFFGGIIAISAFVWAVRNKQFRDLNDGAYTIFDDEEPVGEMTENTFGDFETQNGDINEGERK